MNDFSHVAGNLDRIRSRMEAACRRSGRSVDEVTLIAVSKTFPLEAIQAAHAHGQNHFGENKPQELAEKCSSWNKPGDAPVWHMIGHLQRNKASLVLEASGLFHALDSERLARTLDQKAQAEGRVLECLVQVNVSGEDSKFGLAPEAVGGFLDFVSSLEGLRVTGLMTLAAPTDDPEDVRPQFQLLRRIAQECQAKPRPRVSLERLSMGMSGDFEVAIEEGATHVRIGSAIFGDRSYL